MDRMLPVKGKTRLAVAAALLLCTLGVVAVRFYANALQGGVQPSPGEAEAITRAAPLSGLSKGKLGLSLDDPRAFQGYTLLAPLSSTKTYLIDMQGRVVQTWQSDYTPALSVYLLDNGHLLRTAKLEHQPFGEGPGGGPGAGGRVQEFTWDGKLFWDFQCANEKQLPHHDVCKLPNGNVLVIAWEKKSPKEVLAAGRRREFAGDGELMPDCILEVKRTSQTSGQVVWEWHVWDHLIQDQDRSKANFGDVAAHPERIDINYGESALASMAAKKDGLEKLRSIGYIGSTAPVKPQSFHADWTHINSVAYNPELDQILLSVNSFSEIWVIDHSTTTAQAAGHKGGRHGKGGDLLYRWGNPQTYRAGTAGDRQLFHQHDAQWIPRGLPGAGHVLVFNNGFMRPGGSYSSVDEIVLPVDQAGRYTLRPATAYEPDKPVWSYTAPEKSGFFAALMSGAHRLPNGNTLICSTTEGMIFEVTPEKEIVWMYTSDKLEPRATIAMHGGGRPAVDGYLSEHDSVPSMRDASPWIYTVFVQEGDEKPNFAGGVPGNAAGVPGNREQLAAGAVFRAYRYGPNYPGLAGRDLTPGKGVEELPAQQRQ